MIEVHSESQQLEDAIPGIGRRISSNPARGDYNVACVPFPLYHHPRRRHRLFRGCQQKRSSCFVDVI